MIDGTRAALLIVDVQNDFCSGGALAVPDAERVVSTVNRYLDDVAAHGALVYSSRDWHPAVTKHFKLYGGPWPVHCVQGTDGASFHPNLRLPVTAIVVTKERMPTVPAIRHLRGTPLTASHSFRTCRSAEFVISTSLASRPTTV